MVGNANSQVLLLIPGILVSLLGGVMMARPRQVARFQEQMDAIGSKRRLADVEPADWNVSLNRLGGAIILLVGIVAILGGLGITPL